MTRPLLLTAACGFVSAVICFIVAVSLGPTRFENWAPMEYGFGHHGRHGLMVTGDGPQTSRALNWDASDRLSVEIPADVAYTQGPASRMSVAGPKGMVDHLVVDGGVLRFDTPISSGGGLKIELTAPSVHRFAIDGSGRLTIANYDQDDMRLSIAGSGDVTAKGRAGAVKVDIAGSGDADLGGLDTQSASVGIAGSGGATIAPRQSAKVSIAGSGDVTLTTQPAELDTNIFGSGHILHAAPSAAPAAAKAR